MLLTCLFAHLFVLGLAGQQGYAANLRMRTDHLLRGAKVASALLAEVHAGLGNRSAGPALASGVAWAEAFNRDFLVDSHELLVVRRLPQVCLAAALSPAQA